MVIVVWAWEDLLLDVLHIGHNDRTASMLDPVQVSGWRKLHSSPLHPERNVRVER